MSPFVVGWPNGEAPSLHDMTFHWLHGNFIPNINYHYFWHGLIAFPKNTLPIYINCLYLPNVIISSSLVVVWCM
jgi:hypothetical protein